MSNTTSTVPPYGWLLNQQIIDILRRRMTQQPNESLAKPYSPELDKRLFRQQMTPQQQMEQLIPPQLSPPYIKPWERYRNEQNKGLVPWDESSLQLMPQQNGL